MDLTVLAVTLFAATDPATAKSPARARFPAWLISATVPPYSRFPKRSCATNFHPPPVDTVERRVANTVHSEVVL